MLKAPHVRTTFEGSDVVLRGRCKASGWERCAARLQAESVQNQYQKVEKQKVEK
jgi:hypothetical protein